MDAPKQYLVLSHCAQIDKPNKTLVDVNDSFWYKSFYIQDTTYQPFL